MAYIQYPGLRCGQLDLTKMSIDDYIASGGGVGVAAQGTVWVRASVEEKVYPLGASKGKIVFKFNDPVVATICPNDYLAGKLITDATSVLNQLTQKSDNTIEFQSNSQTEYARTDSSDITVESKKRVDFSAVNQYSLFPPAVLPYAVAVPLRSNIRPYGPYATSNFHNSCGGINVEVDKDIAPWVFGSVDLMNTAAMVRLSSTEIDPLVIGTTGSVTVPCLPQISLGYSMLLEGPVLNGLSVNFGSSGISTTYSYQTFTPKFGTFSRTTLDRIKLIAKNRREQLKLLRNNQILSNRIARQRSKVDYRRDSSGKKQESLAQQSSLTRVFIAEMMDWWKGINYVDDGGSSLPVSIGGASSVPMYGPYSPTLSLLQGNRVKSSPGFGSGPMIPAIHNSQRTVVGAETLSKQVLELRFDYEKKAFMSMDGFYGPISVSGDGNLPQYAKYEPKCHRQSPLSPQPPFGRCSPVTKVECEDGFSGLGSPVESLYYNQKIEQKFQNPVQNPTSCHHHLGTVHGHIIDSLGRKRSVSDHMLMNLNTTQDYADDYRFLGLRGPLVLHAWGYDTWGKPIPNEADIEADTMKGVFEEENLKDRFLGEWLSKPATWPVGPVDLRFDRDRGVWVSPPQDYKVIVVELIQDLIPFGTALAQLINKDNEANKDYGPKLWDFEGNEINATSDSSSDYVVTVEDRIKASYKSGTRLYAHYDTYSCKYIVFGQVPPSETTDIIRFRLFDDNCIPQGSGDCDWKQYAGYRDKFINNHTFGVRINCDGNPIDIEKKLLGAADLDGLMGEDGTILNPENKPRILVNLYDTAGEHGPAYALYTTFQEWKEKAHTGFAAKIFNSFQPEIPPSGETGQHACGTTSEEVSPSGLTSCEELCVTLEESETPGEEPTEIVSCACTMGSTECGCPDVNLPTYDILFLEGYARFIHATLLEDLYPTNCGLTITQFAQDCKCGNAAANIDGELFYGNSPNGRKPTFYSSAGQTEFRIFDPFEQNANNSPFKNLKAGNKVLAIFNEKEKKYYIYQSETLDKLIKFALIEDKKTIGQICTTAIRVDSLNRPIKADGVLISSDNELEQHKIIVVDPIAEKASLNNIQSLNSSILGPALGSSKIQEHYIGETLYSYNRGSYSGSIIKPFTGFAKYREVACLQDCLTCSGETIDTTAYDIVTLENFANFIEFEAAEDITNISFNYAANFYHYYDGTVPVGRKHSESLYHHDRLVNTNIYDVIPDTEEYKKRPSYIVGEIIGNQGQGCKGIAKLDSKKSTTDELIYNIVDAQTQALFGKFRVLDCTGAVQLNYECEVFNDAECDPKHVKIYWFGGGFEWSESDPLTCARLGNVKIINKHEWCGKWYHEPAVHNGAVINTDIDEYYIYDAYPIANVKFGKSEGCGPPSGCNDACDYLDGIHPTCCHPTTENCIGPFLTYSGAQYVAYWNEDSAQYNMINAEEAPILIEGTLLNNLGCCDGNADVEVYAATNNDDGLEAEPIKTLVHSCANPRGWCGNAGDQIVIHRRQEGSCYTYKILSIGKACSDGLSSESGNCLLGSTETPHEIGGCDYRYFNARIECFPGFNPTITQQLMHGKGFGLMWHQTQSYQTKVIHGCWDGSTISVQGFAGYDGKDSSGESIVGQSIGVSNPTSCCNSECGEGSVFAAPEGGTAWATATYMSDGSGCGWILTNAECCNSCAFSGCDECESC